MAERKFGKKNHVSLNPLDANICLLGTPKVGKTTIMKEIAEKLVGDNYIFLEMYREGGAKYIENIVYEDVPDFETFVEIVDTICEERTTTYKDLKVIFIDTIDNAMQLCEQESCRLWNKECRAKGKPDQCTDNINAAWSGFQRGQDKAMDLFQEQLFKLRNVGVAFSLIGHIRTTNITDPVSLETYQQLTSDVSQRYFNQLKKNIDLVGIAYVDREIVKEKGKTTKDAVNKVASETRKIKFRDSNYTIDAGGRMSQICDEIPFDADEFIKAMRDALEAEVKKGGVSIADRQKEDAENEAKMMEKVAAAEASNKAQKEIDTVVAEIITFMKDNRTTKPDALKAIMALCKENGVSNPQNITDMDLAQQVLALCK